MQRFGQVIGLDPASAAEYERLHERVWPGVPFQRPVEERAPGEWWHTLREVFHTD